MIQKRGKYYYVYDRDGVPAGRYTRRSSAETRQYNLGMGRRRRRYRDDYYMVERRRAPRGYHYTASGQLRRNQSVWAKPAED